MLTETFQGSVSLIDMSDITADSSVGIERIEVYYALSTNGEIPPDLEEANFGVSTEDNEIVLNFEQPNTAFHYSDGIIHTYQEDKKIELSVSNEDLSLSGPKSWSPIMPEVKPGTYLWIKTIYYLTDGSQTVTYNVSRQGEDGLIDLMSPELSNFRAGANQKEIYKFIREYSNETIKEATFSPSKIEFFILREYNGGRKEKIPTNNIKKFAVNFVFLSKANLTSLQIPNDCIIKEEDCFSIDLSELKKWYLDGFIKYNDYLNILREEWYIEYHFALEILGKVFDFNDIITSSFGINKDMAKFSIETNKIVSAITNTKMEFTAEGLKIYNGGFEILKKEDGMEDEELLVFDEDTGNLRISGIIEALGGHIGGFVINENEIYSSDGEGMQENNKSSLVLRGSDGYIYANNIQLGSGARIGEYIQLGNAKIWNPNVSSGVDSNRKFIEAGRFSVSDYGELKLGTIQLFSGDSEKKQLAFMKSENNKWIIKENGEARFEDIYANNLHLQDTILEIGTVQSLGSLMIFKDCWEVEAIINVEKDGVVTTKFIVPSLTTLQENDWIYAGDYVFKISNIEIIERELEEEKKQLTYISLTEHLTPETHKKLFGNKFIISKFGKSVNHIASIEDLQEESIERDRPGFILSVLGESQGVDINRAFAHGNSFAISDFEEVGGSLAYRKRLILGQLDGLFSEDINTNHLQVSGLGLYADNVFLNGSLTTVVKNDREKPQYAGINTTSGIKMPETNLENDDTEIVFWAGAESNTVEAIQSAPFIVTSGGSIYAQKGIFQGKIQAADIYTAKIYGNGKGGAQRGLTIYDSAKGISFSAIDEKTKSEKETFYINTEGMFRADSPFISVSDENITFSGDKLELGAKREFDFSVDQEGEEEFAKIAFYNGNQGESQSPALTALTFKKDSLNFEIAESEKMSIQDANLSIKTDNILFGKDSESYIRYEKVDGGFDLFINEIEGGVNNNVL